MSTRVLLMITAVTFGLTACGWGPWSKDNDSKPYLDPIDEAKQTEQVYQNLRPSVADSGGFLGPKCDSVGFTALAVAFGGYKADLTKARDADGRWYRHWAKDCYPIDSKTSFSRDHALMLMQAWWSTKDRAEVELFINYIKAHGWRMGDGNPVTTSMVPLVPLLYRMRAKLGGVDEPVPADVQLRLTQIEQEQHERGSADGELGVLTGFEAHLQVLHIWLDGRVDGAINDINLAVLKKQADRQPQNYFFRAAAHLFSDGEQAAALQMIHDVFPRDRLPTSADWCEFLPVQRDDGPDWQPCPKDGRTHAGIELAETLGAIQGL